MGDGPPDLVEDAALVRRPIGRQYDTRADRQAHAARHGQRGSLAPDPLGVIRRRVVERDDGGAGVHGYSIGLAA